MGIFDFAKDAGSKVGLKKKKEKAAAIKAARQKSEAKAAKASDAARKARLQAQAAQRKAKAAQGAAAKAKKAAAAEARELAAEERKADQLEEHVAKLGLKARNLDIKFDDGSATITGVAANAATREKIVLAVGNVKGVSRVHDRLRTTAPKKSPVPRDAKARVAAQRRRKAAQSAQTMHTVKKGDTLGKIAKKYLGDANRYPEVFKANQPMLSDPNKIYPGQVLRIPRK